MFEKSIVLLLIFTFIVSAKEDVPYFATSIDDEIVLYNLNDGSKVKELKPHIGTIISASFSKNAQYLSISGDKQGSSAIVYDVKSGFTRKYFPPHSSYTNSVSLSTDYKLVATSSNDSLIKISYLGEDVPYFATSIDDKIVLYNLNDGSKVKELKPHIGTIISVSFSKNAQYLSISGDKQGSSAIVYDVKSGFTRKYFPPHSSYTNSVSLSTDYKLVATSSNDSLIKISYLGKGKKKFLKLRSHVGEVYDGIFDSTNESIFLSCGADRTIKTWNITDLNHSEVINEFINTNEVIDIQLSFDGKYIAGRSRSNDLNIYRRDGGKTSLQAEHKDFIRAMVFSPIDSNIIVTASDDKTIKIWDISKGEAEATLRGHKNKILFVGFANDGKYIISHDVGGVLKIWDFKNHALLMSYKHINGYFSSIPNIFINVNAAVMEQKKYNVNPNIFSNLGSGFHLLGTSKDITNLSIFKYVDAIYLHNKLNNVLEKYNIDQDTNQEINISKYSGFWLYNKYEDDINIKYKSKKSAKEDLEFVQYIKKLPIGWNLIGRTTKITTPMKFFSTLKEVNIYKNKKLVKIDVNLNTPLKENSGFWVFK